MNEVNENGRLLYPMNPLNRFSERASYYADYRPIYPDETIAKVIANMGDAPSKIVADIGAGTGISAYLSANHGLQVIAIEPNTEMRRAATTQKMER